MSALKVLSPPLVEPLPSGKVMADSQASSAHSIGSVGELTVDPALRAALLQSDAVVGVEGEGEKERDRVSRSRPTSSNRPHAPSAAAQKVPPTAATAAAVPVAVSFSVVNSPHSSPSNPTKRQVHSLATVKVAPSHTFAIKTRRDATESKGEGKDQH